MKIAILTLPLHSNYGGIIQNYALQTVLERMGHEVYTINLNKPKAKMNLVKAPLSISKRIIKKLLGRKDGIILLEKKLNQDKLIIEQHVRRFINDNIHLTKPFYSKEDLKEINDMGFDAIVVGSDQVWRIPYAYPDIQTYFLDFITNNKIKKIAYSASFGTDEIEFSEKEIKDCGELIKSFDFISVREDAGLDLINNKYKWECKNKPIHTLDPTMLLSKEDYDNLSRDYENQIDGELFYYILDMTEDKMKVLEQLSKDLGYKAYTVEIKKINMYDNAYEYIIPPIELWLQAFNKAKFVFTDSFHGCVFSIIYNKKFIAYGNPNRGMNRFTSLLNQFNLQNRLIFNSLNLNKIVYKEDIDWEYVNNTIKRLKEIILKELTNHI